ncbi:MAG: hypothetical protein ACE5L7_10050, partial [Candidatus Aminicenantales bacterium]
SSKRRASRGISEFSMDLCSKSIGGSKGVCPFGRRAKPEKGRQRATASVGRGKAKLFPLQGLDGENSRADEQAYLTAFETVTEIEMAAVSILFLNKKRRVGKNIGSELKDKG